MTSIDYAELETQAEEILRLETSVVTNWKRSWTNEARRELQRRHNFPEMENFYPAEADVGSSWSLAAASRRLTAPARFKEFFGEKDGLYLVKTGEHTPLPARPYEWLVSQYDLDDTGEPEYCQLLPQDDGETVYIDVWPIPDATYYFRLHEYRFLAHFADAQDLTNETDFLIERAPLALRDALLREAYMSLEMRDMTLFAAQASSSRADAAIKDAKDRTTPDTMSLPPSLGAEPGSYDESEWGYPFWGKR